MSLLDEFRSKYYWEQVRRIQDQIRRLELELGEALRLAKEADSKVTPM